MDATDTYKNKEWLEQKYHEEKLNQREIGKIVDRSDGTICRWMEKLGVKPRTQAAANVLSRPGISHTIEDRDGYEQFSLNHEDSTYHIKVHRLCAVAWFGISYFDPRDVHHKNEHRNDNREENLEMKEHAEHLTEHTREKHENGTHYMQNL